jgi:hypothetical protein
MYGRELFKKTVRLFNISWWRKTHFTALICYCNWHFFFSTWKTSAVENDRHGSLAAYLLYSWHLDRHKVVTTWNRLNCLTIMFSGELSAQRTRVGQKSLQKCSGRFTFSCNKNGATVTALLFNTVHTETKALIMSCGNLFLVPANTNPYPLLPAIMSPVRVPCYQPSYH